MRSHCIPERIKCASNTIQVFSEDLTHTILEFILALWINFLYYLYVKNLKYSLSLNRFLTKSYILHLTTLHLAIYPQCTGLTIQVGISYILELQENRMTFSRYFTSNLTTQILSACIKYNKL